MMKSSRLQMWRHGLLSLLLAFAVVGSAAQAAEDVIKLSFATYYPGTVAWADVELAYMKEVEKRSNGRIKFDPVNWKGLFGAKELQGAAGDGAVDVVWASPLYTPADNPLRTLLMGGPFLGETVASQSFIIAHLYDTWEPMREDFHKNGVVPLYIRPGPSMGMCVKGKITGPDDLKGKKVRAHGKVWSAGLANFGAVPVLVEAFDIETQMRAGNLDACSETGGTGLVNIAKNIGDTTVVDPRVGAYGAAHMLMNKAKFDSLPADLQKMLVDLRYEWNNIALQFGAADAQAADALIKENNIPFVRFSDEQKEKFFAEMDVKGEIEKMLAEYESQGVPAQEGYKLYQIYAEFMDKVDPQRAYLAVPDIDMVLGLHKGEPYAAE